MDVAITGASGLIGSALADALRGRGDRVVTVGRGSDADARWDPMAGTIDGDALEGVDAVVHLAGESLGERKWTPEQKERILESRVRGTQLAATTIAELARRPRVLVSGSAVGFYGDRGDEILTEASPPPAAGQLPLRGVCGVGGGDSRRRVRRDPHCPPAHRHRAEQGRGRAAHAC